MTFPSRITIGDYAQWTDNPVSQNGQTLTSATYTLTYALRGATVLNLTGSPLGSGWQTAITVQQSTALTAGQYYWQSYLTSGAVRFTIGQGQSVVVPNYSSATAGFDGRTQLEKDIDAVDAALRAMVAGGAVQEYTIGSRSLKKMTIADLVTLRSQLKYRLIVENGSKFSGDPKSLRIKFDGH